MSHTNNFLESLELRGVVAAGGGPSLEGGQVEVVIVQGP